MAIYSITAILLITVFVSLSGTMVPLLSLALLIPFGFFLCGIATGEKRKELKQLYKFSVVQPLLEEYFSDLSYYPDRGITEAQLKETQMIDTDDYFTSNDLVTGSYKGIGFSQSDVMIEEKQEQTDTDGQIDTNYSTTFKGRFIIFDFIRSFSSNFLIVQNTVEAYLIPGKKRDGTKFRKYSTGDSEFDRYFSVYHGNITAPYSILTPEFIGKLKHIGEITAGPLLLCFYNNKLYVGIDDRTDAFEPDSDNDDSEKAQEEKIRREIHLITDILDTLMMDDIGFFE